jgi:hypothetical protein
LELYIKGRFAVLLLLLDTDLDLYVTQQRVIVMYDDYFQQDCLMYCICKS